MAKVVRQSSFSTLAARVLADHQRAPETPFYDLFSLGTFFDTKAMAQLDAAYAELESAGEIERVDGQSVEFAGKLMPMFRVRATHAVKKRRRSA